MLENSDPPKIEYPLSSYIQNHIQTERQSKSENVRLRDIKEVVLLRN